MKKSVREAEEVRRLEEARRAEELVRKKAEEELAAQKLAKEAERANQASGRIRTA